MLTWFLEDEDPTKLPPVWSEFEFGDLKVFGQYATFNDDLEKHADEFLRSHQTATSLVEEEGLVKSTRPHSENEEEAIFEAIIHDLMEQLKH